MSEKVSGAVFLFQETSPTRLLGSVVSGLDPSGGWTQLVFFQERGVFAIERTGSRVTGQMTRQVSMALIGLYRVALAQVDWLRRYETSFVVDAPRGPTTILTFHVERDLVSFSWEGDHPGWGSLRDVDGQTEWHLREWFAREFETGLADSLGRFAVEVWRPRDGSGANTAT